MHAITVQFKSTYVPAIASLSKRHFCQHGRHLKTGITNFSGILHHSARARKQKTLRLPQTNTNTVFNPVPPRQSDVCVDKNVACLSSLITYTVHTIYIQIKYFNTTLTILFLFVRVLNDLWKTLTTAREQVLAIPTLSFLICCLK